MPRLFTRLILVVAGVALLASPAAAEPSKAKLDRSLQNLRGSGRQRVIIRTAGGNRGALRKVLKARGATIYAEHPSIDALSVDVRVADLAELARNPLVASVASDAQVSSFAAAKTTTGATPHESTLRETLGIGPLSPTGLGIGVAVIDSGIEPLDAFAGRIRAFYDFTGGRALATVPSDEYGHGTHVAGLIGAAQGARDYQYQGVAPMVHFIGLKVLDGRGTGQTSDVIRAIEFATANRALFGIRIINLSLGHPILAPAAADPLVQAVEAAVRAGLVVTVSAGNFGTNPATREVGYAGITSPGNAPSAITVGAVNTKVTAARSDDEVPAYSSRGPSWYDAVAKPDVVAPGHGLISSSDATTYLYKTYDFLRRTGPAQGRYLALSGTSMGTAVTAGVAALVLNANPGANLTPNAVKALLQFTAIPLHDASGVPYDPLTQGAGEINAEGAIRLARAIDPNAAANASCADATLAHESTVGGETLAWSSLIIWGENIVWGETVFANEQAWAENVVWGEQVQWATNIVWGENIVWTTFNDNVVWGENIVWGEDLLRSQSGDNIVWSNLSSGDNIVWGELSEDNIVWGELSDDNVVWGMVTVEGGRR